MSRLLCIVIYIICSLLANRPFGIKLRTYFKNNLSLEKRLVHFHHKTHTSLSVCLGLKFGRLQGKKVSSRWHGKQLSFLDSQLASLAASWKNLENKFL